MPETRAAGPDRTTEDDRLLWLLLIVPLVMSLVGVWTLDHAKTNKPLFSITNLIGPTAQSLLAGDGLTVCTEDMGTQGNPICFHAARMPMSAMVVALGIRLFGDHYLRVAAFKTLLLLLPVALAIWLVWRCRPPSNSRALLVVLLLLAPFAMTAFLADVANILVDEGYSYGFLALAVALLFFGQTLLPGLTRALVFALAVDVLYLAKSGMQPVVVVLVVGFVLVERKRTLRWLVVALVAAAPLGWGLHQYHASGRFSVGTSLDGLNLHKGNNAGFLEHYPPAHGESIDWYDFELSRGLHFNDEWSFSDYHWTAALDYIRTHPRETLQGDLRKLNVLFFSFQKYGGTGTHGITRLAEDAGMVAFRLMLWTAIATAIFLLFRTPGSAPGSTSESLRLNAAIFLAVVVACATPNLAGFAYTRHVSILIYPSALFCCRVLCVSAASSTTEE
jgi:hypothetical protein